jgi:MinD-like ATPase involved in chromosome partitioning or flagellar assembly
MTDRADPLRDPLPLQPPSRRPAHAAPESRRADPADALTEILPLEDLQAELDRQQPSPGLLFGAAPPATRVYEDWQIPPTEDGYVGPAYVAQPHRELYVAGGFVPALVELDQLQLRRKSVPAKQGWRAAVHNVTRINLPPGRDEVYELALKDRVQRMVRTTFPIAVMGVKGGVGKTVVTEVLGSTFSAVRGDRVIAVDLDPDAGNLISRHGRESGLSLADLAAEGASTRYLDVRAHTSQNKATRLEVLTGPDFVSAPTPLQRDEIDAVMPILGEHYSLVLMDTGTGLKTALMDTVLRQSRALVMVSSASIDSLEETQVSLEWLGHSGYQDQLDTMILVINSAQRGKPNVSLDRAVKQFARQIGRERIFVMPFDDHIFEGRQITLELLSAKTRRRYLELAARISELFPQAD